MPCPILYDITNPPPNPPTCTPSVFVEDTALCLPDVAVIMRPGAPTRLDETTHIAPHLHNLYPIGCVEAVDGPTSFIEGGDILTTGREILVGRSARTSAAGIAELSRILQPWDYSVREVLTPKVSARVW